MSELRVGVTGGSWVTSDGYGRLRDGVKPVLGPGKAIIPARNEVFDRPLPRYGRFDDYTKLGCAAVALALRDAGLDRATDNRPVGIVSSSVWESTAVDLAYYQTALVEGGALASPNLFSYTLPSTMQGESAVHFQLTGPTLCVGENEGRGMAAVVTALRLMAAPAVAVMVAGWLDDPPGKLTLPPETPEAVNGALFVVLERDPRQAPGPVRRIRYRGGEVRLDNGPRVTTLLDLFGG